MKKISLITSLALLTSLGLVGCGGGGSVNSSVQENISIAGTAIDPELQNATVCLDLNQDMRCSLKMNRLLLPMKMGHSV